MTQYDPTIENFEYKSNYTSTGELTDMCDERNIWISIAQVGSYQINGVEQPQAIKMELASVRFMAVRLGVQQALLLGIAVVMTSLRII